jgi:hypothetical protein
MNQMMKVPRMYRCGRVLDQGGKIFHQLDFRQVVAGGTGYPQPVGRSYAGGTGSRLVQFRR